MNLGTVQGFRRGELRARSRRPGRAHFQGALAVATGMAASMALPAPLQAQARVIAVRNLRPVPGSPGRFDTLMIRANAAPDTAAETAVVADVAADSRGHILVADLGGRRVIVLDRQGSVVAVVGREGGGPGEFRGPGSIAVGPGGAVSVFDLRSQRLTTFDRDFRVLGTAPVAGYPSATSMLAIGDDVVFAGMLRVPGAEGKVIHVLAKDGRWLRSFGRLAEVRNPAAQQFVSGGILAAARNGGIWFTQSSPYLIERYSLDGTLQVRIRRPNDFLPSAESAFRIEVSEGRTIFRPPAPFARAAAIQELDDGTLLAQTLLPSGLVVTDVFRPSPDSGWTLVGSYEHPGPVLLRRGPDGTFLGLVRSEGLQSGGVVMVRYTRGATR